MRYKIRDGKFYWVGQNVFELDLSEADLQGADLRGAKLWGAKLWGADLQGADLQGADLQGADLREAKLWGAKLWGAKLQGADLQGADLRRADLRGADLRRADLRGAKFWRADLQGVDLQGVDFSGVKGLLSQGEWLTQFEKTEQGIIVYKRVGRGTEFSTPEYWEIKKGAILTEVVNPVRTDECGCGVNFGTLEWCYEHYKKAELWKCLIPFEHEGAFPIASVVVPYNTDGKARCELLILLEKIDDV